MKLLLITFLLFITVSANPTATAYWTGRVRYVTTITYQPGVSCEYQYLNNKFWRTFTGSSCPSTVEVR